MRRFFYDGKIPSKKEDVLSFLERLRSMGDEGLAVFGREIQGFHRSQLEDFHASVLPHVFDEDVLRLVYQSPTVVDQMGVTLITKHFKLIYDRVIKDQITPEFYEACAASLVANYDTKVNLLTSFSSAVIDKSSDRGGFHTFSGGAFDLAMSKHLAGALTITQSHQSFKDICKSLFRIELPRTLEVFLQDKVNVGANDIAAKVVSDLFTRGKLTDSYLPVCRKVLGDALFLEACVPYVGHDSSIHSVIKLAPIFGEATFHAPAMLRTIKLEKDENQVLSYADRFHLIGFDETKLPLLANHIVDNAAKATRMPSNTSRVGFIKDLAKMAVRLDRGAEVLQSYTGNLRALAKVDAKASLSEVIEGLYQQRTSPQPGPVTVGAYNLLIDVVESVGLNALQAIAQDAPPRFVSEFFDKTNSGISRAEVMALYPKARGYILENDLGL